MPIKLRTILFLATKDKGLISAQPCITTTTTTTMTTYFRGGGFNGGIPFRRVTY